MGRVARRCEEGVERERPEHDGEDGEDEAGVAPEEPGAVAEGAAGLRTRRRGGSACVRSLRGFELRNFGTSDKPELENRDYNTGTLNRYYSGENFVTA